MKIHISTLSCLPPFPPCPVFFLLSLKHLLKFYELFAIYLEDRMRIPSGGLSSPQPSRMRRAPVHTQAQQPKFSLSLRVLKFTIMVKVTISTTCLALQAPELAHCRAAQPHSTGTPKEQKKQIRPHACKRLDANSCVLQFHEKSLLISLNNE